MSSHLPKVTELDTGRTMIGMELWVALAWVPGAQVDPYLIGRPRVGTPRWQSLGEGCKQSS